MSEALIQRNDATLSVSYTPAAIALRDSALEKSGIVGKVTTPEENATAVEAQVELQSVKSIAEKARKAAKEPVLEYGRKIDQAAKDFIAEIDAEGMRVARLVGDYQALEAAKVRAAEQARNAELQRIEREKAEAIAKAKTHEQVDAIAEHFADKAAQQTTVAPAAPIRADGQVVKTDWEITITNPYDLAKFHPGCVNISPRLADIKQLLNEGVTVRGITATKVTRAGVRLAPSRALIEV